MEGCGREEGVRGGVGMEGPPDAERDQEKATGSPIIPGQGVPSHRQAS